MDINNQLPQIVPALGSQLLEQGIPQHQVAQTLNSLHIVGDKNVVFQDINNNQINLLLPLDSPQMLQRIAKRIALHLRPNSIPHHIGDAWQPNTVFFGRTQDIKTISEQLRNHGATLLLNGIGGMGKTALANQIRHQIGDRYDHVIWTNLQNTPDKDEKVLRNHLLYSSHQLHRDLGIADVLRNEHDEARKWVILLRSLKQLGSEVLWIIDNAHQQDHNTINSLPDNCHILLTSRHTIENIPTHYVNELEKDDVLCLFKHYYPLPDDDHTILDVCRAVGYHALSIELLAKTLNELPNKDVSFLLQELNSRGINIKRQQQVWTNYAQRETYLNKCLLAAFDLGKLMEQSDLHLLLRFFCLMPYQDIAYSVVEQLTQTEDEEAEDELLHHLQQLSKLGWLKPSQTNWFGSVQKSWRMHTIVQDAVQQQLGHDEGLENKVASVLVNTSFQYYEKHPIEAQEWCSFLTAMVKKVDRKIMSIAWCYDALSHLFRTMGYHDKALLNNQKALSIAEQILPPQHLDLASFYMNTAVSYNKLSQYDTALAYYERCRAIREQILPAQHPDLAGLYMNMAITYRDLSQYDTALIYHEHCRKIWEQILPAQHPNLAMLYMNMGNIYKNLRQYDTALVYYERCRAIREQVLPAQHPDLAGLYMNMAITYKDLNQYDTALIYHEHCRKIWEKLLPAQHPNLAMLYMNMANTYLDLAQHDTALAYYERCRTIWEQILPAQHPNLAMLYMNIASLYAEQSQFMEGKAYIDKAVAIYQQILSPEHFYLQETLELRNTIHQHLQPQ
jgi:tetratricopeptide (TPR) repeat protein